MNLTKPDNRRRRYPTALQHAQALLEGVKRGDVEASAAQITRALIATGDATPKDMAGLARTVEQTPLNRHGSRVMRGFSIVEVLILAAILGILAAVLMPPWRKHDVERIELVRTEWVCTQSETTSTMQFTPNGPMPVATSRCTQFNRIPKGGAQ